MSALQTVSPGQYITPPTWLLTPPLTQDRNVYISAAGNDTTGDGSQANPWRQPTRAWSDRQRYGRLRAKYRLNCVGTGPFDWPVLMGSSDAGDDGYFIIAGDAAAQTVLATGSFTGDINQLGNGLNINTTAGMGAVDSLAYDFVRITSGSYNGCILQIVANTDTSLTFADAFTRSVVAVSMSGATFTVFRPGSQMVVASGAAVTGPQGVHNWQGGGWQQSVFSDRHPRHILFNLRFTGSALNFTNCSANIVACRFEAGLNPIDSTIVGGGAANGGILGLSANARNCFAYGAGFSIINSSFSITGMSVLRGFFSGSNASSWFWGGQTQFKTNIIWEGGKIDAPINGICLYLSPTSDTLRRRIINKTITLTHSDLRLLNCTIFAVTAGSCVVARMGSRIFHQSNSSGTSSTLGSTTDPAGYAFDLRGGGQLIMELNAPQVTGLAGDVRMTSGAFPNATFALAGSTAGLASDNARGEFAYRL